jgi:hypothetical protein
MMTWSPKDSSRVDADPDGTPLYLHLLRSPKSVDAIVDVQPQARIVFFPSR